MLDSAGLPDVLLGIVLVLLISASVSTLASITITASTTLTMDFLQAKLFKQMAQEKAGLLAKAVAAAFIAVSFLIANTEHADSRYDVLLVGRDLGVVYGACT